MGYDDRYYHEQFHIFLEMGCFKDRIQDGGSLYPEGSGSGRSHVVLFSTWSTKYSLPFWSTRCSHLEHHDSQSDQPRPAHMIHTTNQISQHPNHMTTTPNQISPEPPT